MGGRFSERLIYESSLIDAGRDVFVLGDGGIGACWEIQPIPHEIKSEQELQEMMNDFAKIFKKITDPRVTLQIIFDQKISPQFTLPLWPADTYARKVLTRRIEAIQGLASGNCPSLYRRKIYLTLRVDTTDTILRTSNNALAEMITRETEIINEALITLRGYADTLEDALNSISLSTRMAESDLLMLLRDMLHGESLKHGVFFKKTERKCVPRRLAEQVMNGSLEWQRDGIGIGNDTWEVISWSQQPAHIYAGMMTKLMQIKEPLLCVLNIRPVNYTADLEGLAAKLKGGDPYQERQKHDVYQTEDRVVGGEKLLNCSLHVFVRNVDVPLTGSQEQRKGEIVCRELSDTIPCFREICAAFPVFISCLPLHYSARVAGFVAREQRVLSDDLGYLLPVFGGTRGTTKPKQLMQARSGEAIWLNQRASKTNPHFAVFGASQSGKSFWFANFLISEFAADPKTMVFLIDSITSVEYLGKAIAADHGFHFIKPPAEYPNLFRGKIDAKRLPVIVSILDVAVNLVCKTSLTAAEQTLLSASIRKVYEDNHAAATTIYQKASQKGELGSYQQTSSAIRLPCLTDVVNKLNTVAATLNLEEKLLATLREKLLPFCGRGPYAPLFDQNEKEQPDTTAAGLTIYDLAELPQSPLRTLVTLILIADIERQFNLPVNQGRTGCLIIEEAGVNLAGGNKTLENYIRDAFARFAKKQMSCGAITNQSEHYLNLPACRAAWNTSATNIILPVMQAGERKRLSELTNDDYIAALAASLDKQSGKFSEHLWLGDEVRGSVSYVPTGHDYWLAANHTGDVKALQYAHTQHDNWQQAIDCLATIAPHGFRDASGQLREMTDSEKKEVTTWLG